MTENLLCGYQKRQAVTTICKSQNCFIKSNKSIHIPNFDIAFNKLTTKDKRILKQQPNLVVIGLLSYLQSEKLILEKKIN